MASLPPRVYRRAILALCAAPLSVLGRLGLAEGIEDQLDHAIAQLHHRRALLFGPDARGDRPPAPLRMTVNSPTWPLDVAALLGAVVVGYFLTHATYFSVGLYRGGFLLVAIGSAAIVLAAGRRGTVTARLLGTSVLCWIGVRSYAIYLWHWPVFMLSRPRLDYPSDGVPLMALWGFANPATLGLMSRRVGPHEQGQVQGANGSIAGIANMIGPGLFTQVFAVAIGPEQSWHLPGAPFALAALMLLAAIVITWRVTGERANGE